MRPILLLVLLLPAWLQAQETNLPEVLRKLDAGESVENLYINLGDINFATGTANLEAGAKTYLNQVVELLFAAPNLNLLVKGHTDNTGSDAVNSKLSVDRAQAVVTYLISKGAPASRLEAKGFGSSMPVAGNGDAEGRARNRRVEMEIIRKEEAKTIQDIIVLRNGARIGATVKGYDDNQITYTQFSKDDTQTIATAEVDRILFADGRVVEFGQTYTPTPDAPNTKKSASGSFRFRPFAESEAFHPGQFVLGLGYGLKSNIGIGFDNSRVNLPPVILIAEFPLKYNFGLGFSAGAMRWQPEDPTATDQYGYYALSPRLAWHVNLGSRIDLYAGGALNTRLGTLSTQNDAGEDVGLTEFKFNASMFGGVRLYPLSFLGLFGEYGGDSVSCWKAGLALRFGK